MSTPVGFYRKGGKTRPRHSRKFGSQQHGHPKLPSAGIKHEGSLLDVGYNLEEGNQLRHGALDNAASRYGYARTVEKVNALAVLNKRHRDKHAKLQEDLRYLEANRERLGAKSG